MKKYITSNHIAANLANLKQLVFEVTDSCNLRCTYCTYGKFYGDYDYRGNKTLPLRNAIGLIDYLAKFWSSDYRKSSIHYITISFYGGEPLLNISFIRAIVDYVESGLFSNIVFRFSMTTNALLLHKHMDFLVKHNFSLLISLDGNKENTCYRIDKNGNNSYDVIVEKVNLLRDKYPDYFEKKVNFNAVLHNRNSVESIYNYFKEKYNKKPRIGEINDIGVREDMKTEFAKTYRNAYESLHQSEHYEKIEEDLFLSIGSYRSLATYFFQYSGFSFNDYTELLFDKKVVNLPTGTCLPFAKKIFVTVNGKILPCERIGHQFALGQITESGTNLDLEAIADKYNAYYAKMEKQCLSCKRIKSCTQCMFNLENLEIKPSCHGYMDTKSFQRYENFQMDFLRKHPKAYKEIMDKIIIV